MKSLNRTLSLVLVLVMVLGLFGVAGATFNDQDEIENTEAVSTMVALNIINGKNGNIFDPTGNVTRAEMAKMICIALNGGKEPVLGVSATPLYSDIGGHWGQKYIEYCASLGIIAGMGDGTFAPDAAVTGSQAAKMMLVAMNYNAKVFGFEGTSWEVNVNVAANKAGLYADINVNASDPLSRDNAAQLIYNGIDSPTMERTWSQDPATGKITETYALGDATTSIAATKYGLKTTYGVITNVSYNAVTKKYDHAITQDASSTATFTTFATEAEYSSLFQMGAKVLYKDNTNGGVTVYGAYASDSSVVLAGVVGQLSEATFNNGSLAAATEITLNGTTYKTATAFAALPAYNFNVATGIVGGVGGFLVAMQTAPSMAAYNFKAIDTTGDNKIDAVIFYPFTVHKLSYVGASSATYVGVAGSATGSIDLEDDVVYSGLAKGDYVKKTAAVNTVSGADTYENIGLISGKVERTTTTSTGIPKVQMNGIWFVNISGKEMKLGSSYDKIAQVNTFVFDNTLGVASVSGSDYAVVISAIDEADDALNGAQAKLLFSDGTTKTVKTAADYKTPFTPVEDKLATFTKSASDKYTLTDADPAIGGYDTTPLTVTGDPTDFDDGKIVGVYPTAGKYTVSDNAVIFVAKYDGSTLKGYEVMTGAKFKTLSGVLQVYDAYVSTNSSTGFKTVELAYVKVASDVTSADTNYGYMTDSVKSVLDGDDSVFEVTFWNGTENVTKIASVVPADMKTKGTIFKYNLDSDGRMVVENLGAALVKAEVDAYDGTNISFSVTAPNSTKIDADDTVVFYVNSKETKGVVGGEIQLAQDGVPNAFYVDGGSGNPFAFIVFDVNNKIETTMASTTVAGTVGATAINNAFDTYNTVTVTGTLPTGVAIPAGKTLVVSAAQTSAVLESITAAATARLTVLASSDGTDSTANKWFDNDGVADTTDSTDLITTPGTTAIPANTYVYGTYYYQTSTVADTTGTAWVKA